MRIFSLINKFHKNKLKNELHRWALSNSDIICPHKTMSSAHVGFGLPSSDTVITPISSKTAGKLLLAGSQRCAATVQSNTAHPLEMSSGVTPLKGQIYWSYSCLRLLYLGDVSLEITALILNVVWILMKITAWHFAKVWEENMLIELCVVYVGYIYVMYVPSG